MGSTVAIIVETDVKEKKVPNKPAFNFGKILLLIIIAWTYYIFAQLYFVQYYFEYFAMNKIYNS